jgi:hypothetical protein
METQIASLCRIPKSHHHLFLLQLYLLSEQKSNK